MREQMLLGFIFDAYPIGLRVMRLLLLVKCEEP